MHGVPAEERFWTHVKIGAEDECWPYSPVSERDGYGRFNADSDGRAAILAHRYVFELVIGIIPVKMQIDHQCHRPDSGCVGICIHRSCVNPGHLKLATNRENTLRGNNLAVVAWRNDLCMKGLHKFSEVGWREINGGRWCAECARIWQRNYRALKAA